MPIKIGNTNIDNVKLGNNQIDKVMLGNNLVWQNYVAWTTSGQSSKDYDHNRTISYSIPSGNKVTSITGWGTRDNVGSEVGYVTIRIFAYYDGAWHQVAQSSVVLNYTSYTWTNSNKYNITQIRIENGGSTLPSVAGYNIVGLQKGS